MCGKKWWQVHSFAVSNGYNIEIAPEILMSNAF
jgi:hypothetical protein